MLLGPSGSYAYADDEALFRERVAPLLERRCVGCHRGVAARADLMLDTRAGLLRGGESGPAIVAGAADESLLIEMVSGTEPAMPKDGPPLSADELAALREWIASGAAWLDGFRLQDKREGQAWWSLRKLERPAVPTFSEPAATAWIRTPIDAFIWARLRARGLAPAPEADRRTLLRRLTYDLHGLPPTPEEIEAFVADGHPQAYEHLVDRLLASPRYGERWGRHWLDVVHFGETHGYDKDKRRDHAWPYRDYVIRALNTDKPYERFIREQLAGDVLAPDNPDAVVATGFIAAGPWDFVGHVELREDTVEKRKTRALDRDDMVANTISTFASQTAHCARCHDHPFDPIPQVDYYRLQAVFAGVDRQDRPYDDPATNFQRRALAQQHQELETRQAELQAQARAVTSPDLAALDARLANLRNKLATLAKRLAVSDGAANSPSNGYHSEVSAQQDVVKWVQVDLGQSWPLEAVRLVPARPTDFADTPGFGFPLRFQVAISQDADFDHAEVIADHRERDFPNPGENPYAIYLEGRPARYVRVTAQKLWPRTGDFVFALAELQVEAGSKNVALAAEVRALDSIEAGRWGAERLVDGFDSRHEAPNVNKPNVAAALRRRDALAPPLADLQSQREQMAASLVPADTKTGLASVEKQLSELDAKIAALGPSPLVYAVVSHEPRPIELLERGDVEKPGEAVNAGALSCVPDLESVFDPSNADEKNPDDEGSRRAALAEWLVDRRNVLTWRSIVNRVWHYHFGRGLVDTPNDFGRNGSPPTHPELLDWLAVEFRDGGQSLKALHHRLVTSAVYRQAARHDAACAAIDSSNNYLWRMNRRRLEAEEIRDAVLAISGKLDLTLGGPSFELFRFKDDHSPRYDYVPIDTPQVRRRTIYRLITRSVPNPWLETLDCPDPSLSAPVRTTTITALQALAGLNDDFMVRQAQYFAERLQRELPDAAGSIERAYRLCFGRPPSDAERALLLGYCEQHGLANACRLLLNTNEFLFVD